MQQNLAVPGTLVLDAAAACSDVSRSPFGEECHLRVRGTDGAYSIVDYRAPAGFGPARHTHRREDEIIQLLEGRIVVWTPQRGFTMSPGDVVLLPKDVQHAWRAFGGGSVHFTVTLVPGGFAGLTAAAGEVDLYDIGPPLSDEEVARIVAEDRQREERMTLS